MKVAYVDREGYAEINEMLKGGRLEAAFVCRGPYVDGHAQFGLELLAAPQAYGKTVYHSYIIVPKASPARTFGDLRGKRFAFTDPLSNTGKLVPTYMLARLGETPESFARVVAADEPALKSFETLFASGKPRCGQARDVQREFLFGDDAGRVASLALVPLGENGSLGLLAISSADAQRFHPGMSTEYLARMGELIADAMASPPPPGAISAS